MSSKKAILVILLVFSIGCIQSFAETLQCQEVPTLMNYSLKNHFSMHQLNGDVRARTINLFLKFVDPSKLLLFKADEKRLRQTLNALFDSMKSGDCSSLSKVESILRQRTDETFNLVNDELNGRFTLDKTTKIQTDAKKRDYPADLSAKKRSVNSTMQVQIATIMAGDVTIDEAKKQLLKRYELSAKRAKELTQAKMLNLFTESFARALDPHSDYISPEELEEFKISMSLSLEGIGARLSSENGYTIVQEIIPGGSADRAHALQPRDKIIAVGQDTKEAINIVDMDLSDVLKLIRGPSGTKVNLTVLRQEGANSETLKVALIRDKVDMSEQGARMVYETPRVGDTNYKIAVIDLPSFYGSADKNGRDCYADLKNLVQQAASDKVDGMILDLSDNPGGLLNDAVKIAGLFIGSGTVVATQDARSNREVFSDDGTGVAYSGPLLILTSRESASASEILAGALKDYHRALIVGGDHTYGKGSVQDLIPLPSGLGMMKLTTQLFYLPAGESTQYAGVTSDIPIPTYSDVDELGEKNMDYALPHTETTRFISMQGAQPQNPEENWNPISEGLVKYLKERSVKRVENNQEFKEIERDLKEAKKNQSWVSVASILKNYERDKQKRKERKEEAATAKGRQALWIKDPHIRESIHILEDWLTVSKAPLYAKNTVATQPTGRP